MFICCMVLKIELLFSISSNNLLLKIFSGWKQAEQLYLRNDAAYKHRDLHHYAAKDLYILMIAIS